ncbi:transcriptional regulator, variant 3 [Metarhizium acridum]|nr:transcriptional regulator, variant 3 [Metarhizium acridum]
MGGAGFQNQVRQMGGNVSFAQSLSGSQPATPLDLNEFPSLSNNSQLNNANPASMWSTGASRNLSGPVQRNQSTPLSSQQGGQDDLFASGSSRLPSHQTSFRFGNQGNMTTASQGQPSSVDDFPPLNRAGNGEIGSDRSGNLMSLAFGSQQGASGAQRGNGLLNALSANSRANDARSPPGVALNRGQDPKRLGADDDSRQKPISREDGLGKSTVGDTNQNPLGAIGNEDSIAKLRDVKENKAPEAVDPLGGMSAVDKWGIKGLRTLMNSYPDYQAMVVGMDPITVGLDINSQE